MTFREICEQEKEKAAESLFDKAAMFGNMATHATENAGTKKALRKLKAKHARRAIELSNRVVVTIDDKVHLGLPSIQYRGRRIHLRREELTA